MSKMEIDLTPEQEEKVKILKENGVTIGEAIDTLFELKEKHCLKSNLLQMNN